MKKIIIFLLLIVCQKSYGQTIITYWKNLEAYVGIWKYQSNDTTIYLKMGIRELDFSNIIRRAPSKRIVGGYKIIINGVVTEKGYDNFKQILDNEGSLPFSGSNENESINEVDPNKLLLVLKMSRTSEYGDKFPNYQFLGELVLVSKYELIWTVGANTKYPYQPREGRRGNPPSWAYPLPEYAVFKKISDSYD